MRIGKFRKDPTDRKRYIIDYTDWLNETETISTVTATGNVVDDNFFVDGYIVNTGGKEVIFYVSGGLSGKEYDVTIKITTSLQQIKEDYVTYVVTD
jgi:hypothetical protein